MKFSDCRYKKGHTINLWNSLPYDGVRSKVIEKFREKPIRFNTPTQ